MGLVRSFRNLRRGMDKTADRGMPDPERGWLFRYQSGPTTELARIEAEAIRLAKVGFDLRFHLEDEQVEKVHLTFDTDADVLCVAVALGEHAARNYERQQAAEVAAYPLKKLHALGLLPRDTGMVLVGSVFRGDHGGADSRP